MRLTNDERLVILSAIKAIDQNADLYLFGSRVDDRQLGGDIDLLIHSQIITKRQIRAIKWQLMEQLGEQKIDLLLSKELTEPFVRLILPEALLLTDS